MSRATLAMRLTGTKYRIDTLAERMEEIKENGCVCDYNGYIPGYIPDDPISYSSHILSELEENVGDGIAPVEELLQFVAEKCTDDEDACNILYHLNNVRFCISPYYRAICRGKYEPSNEVLECDIGGLRMVSGTLDRILSKLKA